MLTVSVQEAFQALQRALGQSVTCGQLVLNVNANQLESYDIKAHYRVPKPADQQLAAQSQRFVVDTPTRTHIDLTR